MANDNQFSGAFKYRGFISYSQRDKRAARKLHRQLETYSVPAGVEGSGLDKHRRLGRFFRDDDELGAAGELSAALKSAIQNAENLIVLCSPHAAGSRWVGAEIELFAQERDPSRIFAIILSGSPDAAHPKDQCFPEALKTRVSQGRDADPVGEPLAPSLKKDGLLRATTRLVAGMLRVGFDDLWKRAQRAAAQKARRRLAIQMCVSGVVLALAATLYVVDSNRIINQTRVYYSLFAENISVVLNGDRAREINWPSGAKQTGAIASAKRETSAWIRTRLDTTVKEQNPDAGWTVAQEHLALHVTDRTVESAAMMLLQARRLSGAPCWPEYAADGTCHVLATSWALASLAASNIPADPATLDALLILQSAEGWWPAYFSLRDNRQDASTYSTAWALMALSAQARFADKNTQDRIEQARLRATEWLMSSQIRQSQRWRDYPYNRGGFVSDGVSALVVVALNKAGKGARLDTLNRNWLRHLPMFTGNLALLERSNVDLGNSWKWDRTSYVVSPWVALSAMITFADGDSLGRANARIYADRFSERLGTYSGSNAPDYFSVELLYCLSQIFPDYGISRKQKPN